MANYLDEFESYIKRFGINLTGADVERFINIFKDASVLYNREYDDLKGLKIYEIDNVTILKIISGKFKRAGDSKLFRNKDKNNTAAWLIVKYINFINNIWFYKNFEILSKEEVLRAKVIMQDMWKIAYNKPQSSKRLCETRKYPIYDSIKGNVKDCCRKIIDNIDSCSSDPKIDSSIEVVAKDLAMVYGTNEDEEMIFIAKMICYFVSKQDKRFNTKNVRVQNRSFGILRGEIYKYDLYQEDGLECVNCTNDTSDNMGSSQELDQKIKELVSDPRISYEGNEIILLNPFAPTEGATKFVIEDAKLILGIGKSKGEPIYGLANVRLYDDSTLNFENGEFDLFANYVYDVLSDPEKFPIYELDNEDGHAVVNKMNVERIYDDNIICFEEYRLIGLDEFMERFKDKVINNKNYYLVSTNYGLGFVSENDLAIYHQNSISYLRDLFEF